MAAMGGFPGSAYAKHEAAVYLSASESRCEREIEQPCPNELHNDPLPTSFMAASDEAERRLEEGWDNLRCPDCGIYGWVRGEA